MWWGQAPGIVLMLPKGHSQMGVSADTSGQDVNTPISLWQLNTLKPLWKGKKSHEKFVELDLTCLELSKELTASFIEKNKVPSSQICITFLPDIFLRISKVSWHCFIMYTPRKKKNRFVFKVA